MKLRILLTGGSGLLALNWALAVRDFSYVTLGIHQRNVVVRGVNTQKIDLESVENFASSLEKIAPDVVIHTAGLTSVERCESDPKLAHHINVTLTENVAKVCSTAGVQLVYISTDHLFLGTDKMVDEEHPTSPINVYGKTKAVAEALVLAINPHSLVIRTNFYGWGPSYRKSFSDIIVDSLKSGSELRLFQDVYFSPLLAESVAMLVHKLLTFKERGIYNVVGDESISKYNFGLAIAKEFNFEPTLLIPCKLANQTLLTQRPRDMSLSNNKIKTLLGHPIGNIQEQIIRLHQQEYTKYFNELKAI